MKYITILLFVSISIILISSCRLINEVDDECATFSSSNTFEMSCKVKSPIVARRLLALSDTRQPLVYFDHPAKQNVIEYIEYILSNVFQLQSIQHPPMDCDKCNVSINAEWLSYLTIICRLADSMELQFGITKDGNTAVFSRKADKKDVYYVRLSDSSGVEDVYEVWLRE